MSAGGHEVAAREHAGRGKVLRFAPTPLARGAYGDLAPARVLPCEVVLGRGLTPATQVATRCWERLFQPADSTLSVAGFGPNNGVHLTE